MSVPLCNQFKNSNNNNNSIILLLLLAEKAANDGVTLDYFIKLIENGPVERCGSQNPKLALTNP